MTADQIRSLQPALAGPLEYFRPCFVKVTDRQYWLIVAHNTQTDEYKYFVSNAAGGANFKQMMTAAFARWHVEMWFERAKQETGFGAFEVLK